MKVSRLAQRDIASMASGASTLTTKFDSNVVRAGKSLNETLKSWLAGQDSN